LNACAFDTRKRVFAILDREYGNMDLINSAPSIVLNIIRDFYEEVIRPQISSNPDMTHPFSARDLSEKEPIFVRAYRSKDEHLFLRADTATAEFKTETSKPSEETETPAPISVERNPEEAPPHSLYEEYNEL
jgi:hypothetical protein